MTDLAVRATIPNELAVLIDDETLPARVVAEALTTVYRGVAAGDVARALVRCKSLGLNPLTGDVQMIPQTKWDDQRRERVLTGHSVFTTLIGRIKIARRHDPGFTIAWDAPEIREGIADYLERGKPVTEKRIYVTCHIYRSGSDGRATVTKTGSCPLKPHGEEIASARAARNALKYAFPEIFSDLDDEADPDTIHDADVIDQADEPEPSFKGDAPRATTGTSASAAPRGTAEEGSPGAAVPPAGPSKATRPQIGKLIVLAQRFGWTDEQRRERAGVASFRDLTSQQASRLIDEWEAEANIHDAFPGSETIPDEPADLDPPGGEPEDAIPSPPAAASPLDRADLIDRIQRCARAAYPDLEQRIAWLAAEARANGFDAARWRDTAPDEWLADAFATLTDQLAAQRADEEPI